MPANALPPRHRRKPIDAIAGNAAYFERTDGGYLYRDDGCGPAIFVTSPERDAFVRAGWYATLYHLLALVLAGGAAWLTIMHLLPDASDLVWSASTATLVSLAAMLLLISHDHARRAPGRALAGRPIARPARDPDYTRHFGYTAPVAPAAIALLWAATGSGAFAYRAFFAICTVLIGGFVLLRRMHAWHRLRPDRQGRAAVQKAQEDRRTQDRVASEKPVNGCGLIVFFIAEGTAALLVLFGTIAIVLDIAGEPAREPDGGIFAAGFILGFVLAFLVMWLIDKLCKRWTGASAMDSFDWLPVNW